MAVCEWSTTGKAVRLKTSGESHGHGYRAILEGVPAGIEITPSYMQSYMEKRKAGSAIDTTRSENDSVEFLAGIMERRTTGGPIEMWIPNTDARSSDYDTDSIRPGTMDWPLLHRYGRIPPGGGRVSARETVCRVAAGAIAKAYLESEGTKVLAFARKIGNVRDPTDLDEIALGKEFDSIYRAIYSHETRAIDGAADESMKRYILGKMKEGETCGGVIEAIAVGVPIGLGEPVFDKLEADLGKAVLSIPAVKGFCIGAENADDFDGTKYIDQITPRGFLSNNSGGTAAGYSTGQDIVLRATLRPLGSVRKPLRTVTVKGDEIVYQIRKEARRDSCGVPRGVVVVESMVALVLADHLRRYQEWQEIFQRV